MPKYLVTQYRDAVMIYTAEIEAESPQAAKAKAEADECEWSEGDVSQYDDREIPLEDIEEITD